MGLDIDRYFKAKAAGKVGIFRTDAPLDAPDQVTYGVFFPQHDPATGEFVENEVVGVTKTEVEASVAELQAQSVQLQEFLTDASTAQVVSYD